MSATLLCTLDNVDTTGVALVDELSLGISSAYERARKHSRRQVEMRRTAPYPLLSGKPVTVFPSRKDVPTDVLDFDRNNLVWIGVA